MDVSLITVPVNFCPRVGEILAAGLSLRKGKILIIELGSHSLLNGGNSINVAAKPDLWEGKIPATESDLRVGEIPSGVLEGRRVYIAVFEWGISHIRTIREH